MFRGYVGVFLIVGIFLSAGSSLGWAQECQLPPRDCTSDCGRLVPFEPVTGPGYDNYPVNDETSGNQFRSYLRRDLMMLVKHAAAVVACKAASWTPGNGKPLGLGDMSEPNGAIPGTSKGAPGHPKNTHTNGRDIDIAYYQLTGTDNHLRTVCPSRNRHCVSAPNNLDAKRTALFIGMVLTSNRTRVVGVDGRIEPVIIPALLELCKDDTLPQLACDRQWMIASEATNTKKGWFFNHHHHFHVSLKRTSAMLSSQKPSLAPGNRNLMREIELLNVKRIPGHAGDAD